MKTKTPYYKIGQSLPPRHWYQRRVGWFSKAMVAVLALVVVGGGVYGQVILRQNAQTLAAQTRGLEKVRKDVQPLSSDVENIVDVQFVLDKWAKAHAGQTWSVTARSLDGPRFDARINGDKLYESKTAGQLAMTLPLFTQIPAEQHKGIKLDSGKTMASCVNLMIRLGDTACGKEVSKYVDYRKVDGVFKKAGLAKTTLDSNKTQTTSDDMAALLASIRGDILPKGARDAVLKALREQQTRSGVPMACPGCLVANEATDTAGVHDVAIVEYSGGSYVLSVFTKDGSLADISELAGRIQQKILDTISR